MTFSYDPNGSPPGGPRSPGGDGRGQSSGPGGYGQSQGACGQEQPGYPQSGGYSGGYSGYPGADASQSGYGQPSSYGSPSYPQPEYPQQEYPQPGYQQQLGYQGYAQQPQSYASASASPGTPGYAGAPAAPAQNRNWLLLIIGGVVLVVSLCCVLPIAYLASTGRGGQTTAHGTVYQSPMIVDDGKWPIDSGCSFQADGYHITTNATCLVSIATTTDGAVSADVKQVKGATNALSGIVFRRASRGNFYEFAIDGQGNWGFLKYTNGQGTYVNNPANNPGATLGGVSPSSAIKTGLNVTNHLEVRASGSHFDFFVKGAKVGEGVDSSYASGIPGLSGAKNAEVVYTNFKVTQPLA